MPRPILLILGAAVLPAFGIVQAAAATEDIGQRACLFFDDRYISSQSALTREWHQGVPAREPAIRGEWPHLFGSVFFDPDAGVYRMYYEDVWNGTGWILYAESRDARTWTKPSLNLIEINGSTANNCVWSGAELPNVFIDPADPDPRGRLKMLVWSQPFVANGITFSRHVVLRSPDGIHWEPAGMFPMPEPTDDSGRARSVRDTHLVIWDDLKQRYLGTFRTNPSHPGLPGYFRVQGRGRENSFGLSGHRRAVGVSSSEHLLKRWSHIETAVLADARDDTKAAKFGNDPKKYDYSELYVLPFFTYGNHYVGFLSLLMLADESDTVPGTGDLQLTFSHDGASWVRQPDRQTLIARSPLGWVPCFAQCGPPLEVGDEMLVYYTESTATHIGFEINLTKRVQEGRGAVIRSASWRKEGFVSMRAASRGVMETVPFVMNGTSVRINFRSEAPGAVRASLLDESGQPIAGFELDKSIPASGNSTSHALAWNPPATAATLRGRTVRLQLELDRAQIWSFRCAE